MILDLTSHDARSIRKLSQTNCESILARENEEARWFSAHIASSLPLQDNLRQFEVIYAKARVRRRASSNFPLCKCSAVLAIRDEKPELINPANDFDFVFRPGPLSSSFNADKVITPTAGKRWEETRGLEDLFAI